MLRPCPGRLNYRKSPKSTSDHGTGLLVLQLLQSPDRGLDCDSGSCAAKDKTKTLLIVCAYIVMNIPNFHRQIFTCHVFNSLSFLNLENCREEPCSYSSYSHANRFLIIPAGVLIIGYLHEIKWSCEPVLHFFSSSKLCQSFKYLTLFSLIMQHLD